MKLTFHVLFLRRYPREITLAVDMQALAADGFFGVAAEASEHHFDVRIVPLPNVNDEEEPTLGND